VALPSTSCVYCNIVIPHYLCGKRGEYWNNRLFGTLLAVAPRAREEGARGAVCVGPDAIHVSVSK
jgi:hypothetical protein